MRVLCLHGNGTNSSIMQLQTAPMRHELADDHEYEFVEAAVEAPMAEDVAALSSPGSSYYAYYNPDDLGSLRHCLDMLDEYILEEGPFDAVMGFSGGAVLAALYLAEQQLRLDQGQVEAAHSVRCGIFLASASSQLETSFLGIEAPGDGRGLIRIPTVHIWGSNDLVAPTGGQDLTKLCDATQASILVHAGRHEVPRNEYLVQSVHAIRRTLDLI